MPADFLNAHLRHFEDSEILYSYDRWANADHLYGMSAECGLKKLMIAFGMNIGNNGSPSTRSDKVHVNQIVTRYESYRSGHMSGQLYPINFPTAFDDWRAEQRYDNESTYSQLNIDNHRLAADDVNALIKKAQLDGLI